MFTTLHESIKIKNSKLISDSKIRKIYELIKNYTKIWIQNIQNIIET